MNQTIQPNEVYQFVFTIDELNEIHSIERKTIYKKTIVFTLICLFMIASCIGSSAPDIITSFIFGFLFFGLVSHIKGICAYSKAWKASVERICKSTYEYKFFENYIEVTIYRNNEKIHESKCYFTEIERIKQLGDWLFLQFRGQSYIVRKSDLKDNSVIFSFMYQNPAKTNESVVVKKWKNTSTVMFVASLLSLFVALAVVEMISVENKLFIENMWVFFLLTPIPIASVVFGFILKSKGYNYKKNIVAGIIMTILLCIYGSFSFLFADIYNHSDEPIIKVEQTIGIDIPQHKQIRTHDLTQGTQSDLRGYIYSISDIIFEDSAVDGFEKQLEFDEKWLSSVPNDLIGVTSPLNEHSFYDYVLVYNADTFECNVLPIEDGTYRFINILYDAEENQMRIVEYDIDYVR